jgi:hypothetical protein
MALVINDRVKETSTTTGTGAFTLDGAQTGFELLQQELEIIIQLIIVSLIKAQMNLKLDLEH